MDHFARVRPAHCGLLSVAQISTLKITAKLLKISLTTLIETLDFLKN